MGDVAADELRGTHFAHLREAIAATGGTEVKTIGDAVMVSYPGAADALAGAAAMQRAVERHNRSSASGRLAMRVGISAGDATFEDGDWFGTPVVEASRLCRGRRRADPRERHRARARRGRAASFELRSLGALDLKGLPEPARGVRGRVAPRRTTRQIPLPALHRRRSRRSRSRGGAEHRDDCVVAWKETVEGARRAVLVSGEPGIGKTRLVTEVVRNAHDAARSCCGAVATRSWARRTSRSPRRCATTSRRCRPTACAPSSVRSAAS